MRRSSLPRSERQNPGRPFLGRLFRKFEQPLYQRREPRKVIFQLNRERFFVTNAIALLSQKEHIRQALQRIVDLVGEIVRHRNRSGSTRMFQQLLSLTLLSNSHRSKVSENLHQMKIFAVERLLAAMRDDEDTVPRISSTCQGRRMPSLTKAASMPRRSKKALIKLEKAVACPYQDRLYTHLEFAEALHPGRKSILLPLRSSDSRAPLFCPHAQC